MTLETRSIGAQLGDTLASWSADSEAPLVRQTVALLCRERALGHVCIVLHEHEHTRPDESGEPLPGAEEWRQRLLAAGMATAGASPESPAPLVVDDAGRLYLRRDHDAEHRILAALRPRLQKDPAVTAERVRDALQQVGQLPAEAAAAGKPDWQLAAVTAAAASRFLLLTGGPGTGKTTTVARMLSLLLALDDRQRIALCAPTGKAAARMGEAMTRHAATDPALRLALPRLQPLTLHRLLGYRPLDDTFRHGRDRHLPFDVVVVDEASMLDPALLAVLLEALAERARLVLVGDRDQLAAVAAGQVLGDVCRAARPDRGVGARLHDFVMAATGTELPQQRGSPPIADAVITLRENHRFGQQPGLDNFARALADRQPEQALAVLDGDHDDLRRISDPDAVLTELEPEFLAAVRGDAETAIAGLARLRVLAATRHGRSGTLAWNRRVEALLARHDVRVDDPWYCGRPILVTANDHQNRIYNGDLGVVCRDDGGRPQVAFPGPDGRVRLVSTFRVPAHETAWAMTVHKSQGSEFDTIVLAMPDTDGPMWQAPLLYTGITRARRRAILVAERDLLAAGLGRWPVRSSGLADGLRDPD